MSPWFLLLFIFNFNGQYKVQVLPQATHTECLETKELLLSLKVPKRAKYHHAIGLCIKGDSEEEINESLSAITREGVK